jgi:hypothetical protein
VLFATLTATDRITLTYLAGLGLVVLARVPERAAPLAAIAGLALIIPRRRASRRRAASRVCCTISCRSPS